MTKKKKTTKKKQHPMAQFMQRENRYDNPFLHFSRQVSQPPERMTRKQEEHPLAQVFQQKGKKQGKKKQPAKKDPPHPMAQFMKGAGKNPLLNSPFRQPMNKRYRTVNRKPLIDLFGESRQPRRRGNPRTEKQRQAQHKSRFGTTNVPPRGTGLQIHQRTPTYKTTGLGGNRQINMQRFMVFQSEDQRKAVMAKLQKMNERTVDKIIADIEKQEGQETMKAYENMLENIHDRTGKRVKKGSYDYKKRLVSVILAQNDYAAKHKFKSRKDLEKNIDKSVESFLEKKWKDLQEKESKKDVKRQIKEAVAAGEINREDGKEIVDRVMKKMKKEFMEENREIARQDVLAMKMSPFLEKEVKDFEEAVRETNLAYVEGKGLITPIKKETLQEKKEKTRTRYFPKQPAEREKARAAAKIATGIDTDPQHPMPKEEVDYWEKQIPFEEIVVAEDKYTGTWRVGKPTKYEYKRRIEVPKEYKEELLKDMIKLKTDPRVKIKY